jgi:NAD(P)-dependent dehydrogenase (short-subunit alcohol dehydrogenase family)
MPAWAGRGLPLCLARRLNYYQHRNDVLYSMRLSVHMIGGWTMDCDFKGKNILVTGVTSGIGRAAVIELAKRGATVIAAARREEAGRATVESAAIAGKAGGGSARFVRTDIAVPDSIDELFAKIAQDYGRLDGAFNNAGIESDLAQVPDTPLEVFDRVFATNVRGTWLCMRHEMRLMRAQGHGAIVNTASITGVIAFPSTSVYTASKHAVVGMSKAAGLELAREGIRVNCICPGATRSEMSERWLETYPGGEAQMTQMLPTKRLARPEELAAVAIFLLSDAASYMTSSTTVVDGGQSVW